MSNPVDHAIDNFISWTRNRILEAHRASGAQSGLAATSEQQPGLAAASEQQPGLAATSEQQPGLAAASEQQPVEQYFAPESKCTRSSMEDNGSLAESSIDASILFEQKRFEQLIPRSSNPNTKGKNGKSSTIHGSSEEFSSDLLSILDDDSSSDVTIKCGTEVLQAHKNILSARSLVFKTMFSTSMRESAEGNVSIDDIDPAIVRDMLTFIYSNQVQDLSVPKACDLLNAAEKYELQALKRICVDFLMRNLSVANAFLILQKADLYDKNLKSHTIKFISKKFSDLKVTEEWKTVQSNNPTLALEVLNAIVEQLA